MSRAGLRAEGRGLQMREARFAARACEPRHVELDEASDMTQPSGCLSPQPSALSPRPVVLRANNVAKTYSEGKLRTEVLRGVDFALARGADAGDRRRVRAPGKSTLLHILGGLDTLSAGEVEVEGRALSKLSDRERGVVRNRSLGFVYQFHHLLPEFTALENVAMPLLIRGDAIAEAQRRAAASCSNASAWAIACSTSPANCPAASASVARWRARW